MNLVGNTSARWPRTIATLPSSSGWRSASRLERWNSDSSSRNSTPRCASVASPGRGGAAAADEPRRRDRVVRARGTAACAIRPSACIPATLWIRVTSIASARVIARQDRRQPAGEHRLAGPGRALEQQVVAAGGRDLQREHRQPRGRARRPDRARRRRLGRRAGGAAGSSGGRRARDHLGGGSQARDARRPRGLRRARPRAPARAGRSGSSSPARRAPSATDESARGVAQLAAQRQLAEHRVGGRAPRAGSGRSRRAPRAPARRRSRGPTLRRNAGARLAVIRLDRELEARS